VEASGQSMFDFDCKVTHFYALLVELFSKSELNVIKTTNVNDENDYADDFSIYGYQMNVFPCYFGICT